MLLIARLSENDELVGAMIAQIVPSMAFTIMNLVVLNSKLRIQNISSFKILAGVDRGAIT